MLYDLILLLLPVCSMFLLVVYSQKELTTFYKKSEVILILLPFPIMCLVAIVIGLLPFFRIH